MSLHLANPSKQHLVVYYREPVNNLLASVEIVSGGQVEIGHGWTREHKEKVIEQLDRFGAHDAAEVHRKMTKFLGLLYRDKGRIESEEIELGHAALVETQTERSAREATYAALAFDRSVNKKGKRDRLARVTEVEVEQQVERGTRRTGDEVAFSMSVDPDGNPDTRLPV